MDKRQLVDVFHRIVNPIASRRRAQAVLETTGRVSREPRCTPIDGQLDGATFWIVSMNGEASDYVRNIMADNAVRLRIEGRWRTGTAHLLPGDDALARNAARGGLSGLVNRTLGTELLTIRVDLDA